MYACHSCMRLVPFLMTKSTSFHMTTIEFAPHGSVNKCSFHAISLHEWLGITAFGSF